MNSDHKNAVLTLAHHYGGAPNAKNAEMTEINEICMEINADGELLKINFDHTLSDSEDAHRSLVAMIKALKTDS